MHDFLTVEENLRTAMRFFGYATGTGEIVSLPGSVAMYSGLDYGVFNIEQFKAHREENERLCDAKEERKN